MSEALDAAERLLTEGLARSYGMPPMEKYWNGDCVHCSRPFGDRRPGHLEIANRPPPVERKHPDGALCVDCWAWMACESDHDPAPHKTARFQCS